MTRGQSAMLAVAMYASLLAVVMILEVFYLGQPPRHCHYLVPVKAKPGILACSAYPRPVRRP